MSFFYLQQFRISCFYSTKKVIKITWKEGPPDNTDKSSVQRPPPPTLALSLSQKKSSILMIKLWASLHVECINILFSGESDQTMVNYES